jgi:hypothetical protein
MLVEVIKRNYRKHKVGDRFSLKEKQARILILLNRVKEVTEREVKTVPQKSGSNSENTSPEKKKRGRKLGSKNKAKDKPE